MAQSSQDEELEPLFDYSRVQPFNVVDIEDDPFDFPPVGKKKKTGAASAVEKNDEKGECILIDCNDQEEDDWLPPPPEINNDSTKLSGDAILRELRLKRQELASFAQSAEDVLRAVEESVKRDFAAAESMKEGIDESSHSHRRIAAEQLSKPSEERPKIVISIQDKKGPMSVRVYMDDKFEKLFKMYAEKVKLDVQSLVFSFDGDRISPTASPRGLGMEDNDIIEVHVKTK